MSIRSDGRSWALPALLGLIAVWYLGAFWLVLTDDPLATSKLPYPHLVAERFVESGPVIIDSTWVSVSRAVQGFLVGALIAAILSFIMVQARWLEAAFMPYVLTAQMLPMIALVPIAQSVFQNAGATRLFIAAFVTFFSVTIAMMRGLKSVPTEAREYFQSRSVGRWATFRRLMLPYSLPLFFSGLRIAAPLSLIGAILVDLSGAQSGLGYLMLAALTFGPQHATMVWAAMLATLLLGLVMTQVVALVETWALRGRAPVDLEGAMA